MNRKQLLTNAAALLQEDAQAGEESCAIGERLWTCSDCERDQHRKCVAQLATEERRRVAACLLVMAEVA